MKTLGTILRYLFFGGVLFLFIFKLDRNYFFTDEILYVQRGVEHFQGIYEKSLEIPPLPKYIAGALYFAFDENIFLLRLPFALIGLISSYLVYLIIKRDFDEIFGYMGATLFVTSIIIFSATRMVMLEPILHLFWLFFNYFYYKSFSTPSKKLYIISGVFFGLSMGTKATSLILIPFIFGCLLYRILKDKENIMFHVKNHFLLLITSVFTFFITFLHLFYSLGFFRGIFDSLLAIKNVYIKKSSMGKLHVVANKTYTFSPWWAYFYYFVKGNGLIRGIIYIVTAPFSLSSSLPSKKLFSFYWGYFFLLIFGFYQMSGVKNVRYISSMEIPLIMLSVSGMSYLYKKVSTKKLITFFYLGLMIYFLFFSVSYLNKLTYTKYLGLYRYFKIETKDFSEYKRMYVFGSVRSMKWYRALIPNKHMFLYRKDYEIMCPEFQTFDFFAFDRNALLKAPSNYLFKYVSSNIKSFQEINELEDMLVYKKIKPFESVIQCP